MPLEVLECLILEKRDVAVRLRRVTRLLLVSLPDGEDEVCTEVVS
jgi:hypothetical protein